MLGMFFYSYACATTRLHPKSYTETYTITYMYILYTYTLRIHFLKVEIGKRGAHLYIWLTRPGWPTLLAFFMNIEQSLAHWCHILISWPEVPEPRVTRFWGAVYAFLPPHGYQCCWHGPASVLMYRRFLVSKAVMLGIWPVSLRSLLIFSSRSQNCQPFTFFSVLIMVHNQSYFAVRRAVFYWELLRYSLHSTEWGGLHATHDSQDCLKGVDLVLKRPPWL